MDFRFQIRNLRISNVFKKNMYMQNVFASMWLFCKSIGITMPRNSTIYCWEIQLSKIYFQSYSRVARTNTPTTSFSFRVSSKNVRRKRESSELHPIQKETSRTKRKQTNKIKMMGQRYYVSFWLLVDFCHRGRFSTSFPKVETLRCMWLCQVEPKKDVKEDCTVESFLTLRYPHRRIKFLLFVLVI